MARYQRRKHTRVYFATSIVDTAAPTLAELAAAVDLTGDLQTVSNFTVIVDQIDTSGTASPFITLEPGRTRTPGIPTLVFYDDRTKTTERAALTAGTTGYVILCAADIPQAGDIVEVWRGKTGGPANEWSGDNVAARWQCQFFPTAVPNTQAVLA